MGGARCDGGAFVAVVGVMAYFGVQQIREKIELVKGVQFVGHSDDASYALMGKSLSEGRGIYVNYVSTFFIKYPPGIVRRGGSLAAVFGDGDSAVFLFDGGVGRRWRGCRRSGLRRWGCR